MSPETCITLRIHNADETDTSISILLFSMSFSLPISSNVLVYVELTVVVIMHDH